MALGVDVRMRDWEMPPPTSGWVWQPSWPASYPAYKADLTSDYEYHWRRSSFFKKDIRTARRRCELFELQVDAAGAAEWIIDGWKRRWENDEGQEVIVYDDALMLARYMQDRGLYHSFLLLDSGKPIGGSTVRVVGDALRGAFTVYDPAYAWHRPGTYLLDRLFQWAAANGYKELDLGPGHEYKARIASVAGEVWSFGVCPKWLQVVKGSANRTKLRARQFAYRLRRWIGRGPGTRQQETY
jgi:hypothetical protein